jgi:sterol desaturase/sphingolipid hydroxylase (fatty acid hydroxylase superfamily)
MLFVDSLNAFFSQVIHYWQTLDDTKMLILGLGAGAIFMSALEGVFINRVGKSERYDWAAWLTTLRISGLRVIAEAIPVGVVLGATLPLADWSFQHRLWTVPMNTWWGWVLMVLTTDFFFYVMHRVTHRSRWFWASHLVHHSGNQFNLAAAFRVPIFAKISGTFVFFMPQCWLGFSPEAVVLSYGLNQVYQFWIHTDLVPKLGWLEGILNTPSAHRVHHAANVEYLDANYGGVLMLFDRLLGTYIPEKEGVPIRYGLVKKVTTYSAVWICFNEWAGIARDVGRSLLRGRLNDALGYAFMPPGWAPNGQGLTTESLRAKMKILTGEAAGVPPEELLDGTLKV